MCPMIVSQSLSNQYPIKFGFVWVDQMQTERESRRNNEYRQGAQKGKYNIGTFC